MQKKISAFLQRNIYTLLLVILTFCFVYTIFQSGQLLAIAEEGLPLYNPARTFTFLKSFWMDRDLGLDNPFNFPRITFYGLNVLLQYVGLQSWFIQAIVFFILIITAFLSVQKLSFYFLINKFASFISALFYFFNLYALTQVFSRFIYPLIFLWAYLPLFLYLWIRWIDTQKKKYLVCLVLTSFVFSDAFGLTSSVLTLWIPAGLYSLVSFFKAKFNLRVIVASVVGLCIWIIFNLWWLYPVYALQNNSYSSFLENNQTYTSLHEVSIYFPNTSILQLKQEYFLGERGPWPHIYRTSASYTNISLIIFLVAALGVFVSIKAKNWWYLVILGFTSWFIVKGTNPPFGEEFYQYLYANLSFTQILRNPYEKFGTVWLLVYAIFFAFGVNHIAYLLNKVQQIRNLVIPILLLFTFVYLPRPLLNGTVFRKITYIQVPHYYEEANAYVNQDSDGRILQLPYLKDSSIQYTWNYGGEEPSEFLFDNSSISKTSHIPKLDQFYQLLHFGMQSENFSHILAVADVSHIILHHDVVQTGYYDETVDQARNLIEKWKNVELDKKIGELEIYHHADRNGRIYLVPNVVAFADKNEVFTYLLSDDFNPKTTGVISNNHGKPLSSNSTPIFAYNRISAGRYTVSISEAKEPYILVLANNFNQNWIAYLDGNVVEDHFEVNGFANGWVIDKKGDYTIEVVFKVWPWD